MHHKGLALIIAVGVVLVFYFGIIAFEPRVPTQTVSLYYYNTLVDQDETGNPRCSADSVLPVTRHIAPRGDLITHTLETLLRGDLSPNERSEGFTTEFPNSGFRLESVHLDSGILTLRFEDSANFTTGGSCRVTLLRSQIEKTALQFSGVSIVRILPPELFQP